MVRLRRYKIRVRGDKRSQNLTLISTIAGAKGMVDAVDSLRYGKRIIQLLKGAVDGSILCCFASCPPHVKPIRDNYHTVPPSQDEMGAVN